MSLNARSSWVVGLVSLATAGCAADLGGAEQPEGEASVAVTARSDRDDVLVLTNDVGRYWIALRCLRGASGDVGPGYIHQAAVRLPAGERMRTRDATDEAMSDPRNGGWAKFGIHLYRPGLATGDSGSDGRFRIVEGGTCAGSHAGWPYFGAGVSRGWLESPVRTNARGEVAFAVGVELVDGHWPAPLLRVVYRYRVGRDYVRVWTTVTTLCPGSACGGRAYVKEPKYTVSDARQDDPFTSVVAYDDAGAECASMIGRADPRVHTAQCASARRANVLMGWGSGDCARGCLRVRARAATSGVPDDTAPFSNVRLWGTPDLARCDAALGLDRWACLSSAPERNPRLPSPSAACSRGISALRRWEAVRWDPDPDGQEDTQAGFHGWEGGFGVNDCLNLFRAFGPSGESFSNFFSFRFEAPALRAATADDGEAPPPPAPPASPAPPPPAPSCDALGATCAPATCCGGLACAGVGGTCCRPVQSACGETSECCEGRLCVGGACCVVLGDGCSSDAQCCNHPAHQCVAGRCCVMAGRGCSHDDQCCSGACTSGRCT